MRFELGSPRLYLALLGLILILFAIGAGRSSVLLGALLVLGALLISLATGWSLWLRSRRERPGDQSDSHAG